MPFRILLVDDDEDDVRFVTESFRDDVTKYNFTWLEDGDELMEHLRKGFIPDLILLDLNMQAMSGKEALSLIKSNQDMKNIPVVIYTTSCQSSDKKECMDLGANGYYCKPDYCEEIKRMVEEILQKHLKSKSEN